MTQQNKATEMTCERRMNVNKICTVSLFVSIDSALKCQQPDF